MSRKAIFSDARVLLWCDDDDDDGGGDNDEGIKYSGSAGVGADVPSLPFPIPSS